MDILKSRSQTNRNDESSRYPNPLDANGWHFHEGNKQNKKRAVCGGWPSSVVLTMHDWQFEASLCWKLLNLHLNVVCCKPISYIFRVFATQVLRPLSTQHLWVSDPLQLHKQGVAHSLTGKTCFSGRPRCVSLVFFSFMPSSGFCVPDNTSREKTGSAAMIYNSTMQRAEPCIACFSQDCGKTCLVKPMESCVLNMAPCDRNCVDLRSLLQRGTCHEALHMGLSWFSFSFNSSYNVLHTHEGHQAHQAHHTSHLSVFSPAALIGTHVGALFDAPWSNLHPNWHTKWLSFKFFARNGWMAHRIRSSRLCYTLLPRRTSAKSVNWATIKTISHSINGLVNGDSHHEL